MSLNLPPDMCLLESQVAGHTIETTSQKYGMLRNLSGLYVFKPLSKPLYAEREIAFYKQIKEAPSDDELQQFVPRYEGHYEFDIDGRKQLFIKMENLTCSMKKPCVIDIKIGRRTWDPLATANKITMEELKYAACKNTIGLCIPGFQIYNSADSECMKYGKEFGKNLNPKSFADTLKMFLNAQNICYKPLIKTILNQLYGLQKWFTAQREKKICVLQLPQMVPLVKEKNQK
ncbi:inositol polyphosphate multikinase isoform X2 [Episyrphus balteatus]|uniref:inositol polyphosphate multikinase isoform X2 n=1 Tax=Episyrphus balteatus TaxID=286459 RepID=UPI0024865281|nr:inositol polyphosphate multikinase isoform X2 [Episyrphus balteatus]